jgi:Uma2 family endonuclease
VERDALHVMTQTQTEPKLFTFDEFIEWYPEKSLNSYELHKGVIIEMPPPTGKHEGVVGFLEAPTIKIAATQTKSACAD